MFKDVLESIKSYDTIIIHRHSKPDGDALGSQIGLKHIILENFPEKTVYTVGDASRSTYKAVQKCRSGKLRRIHADYGCFIIAVGISFA